MIITNPEWKQLDRISLSTQTRASLEAVEDSMLQKARSWAPKTAKSFTMSQPLHTDYHHVPTGGVVTGYASFTVIYYTTVNEGNYRL